MPVEVGVADGEQRRGRRAASSPKGDVMVTDAVDKGQRAEAKAKGKGGLF